MYRDERYEEAKYRVKISHFTEKGHNITGVMHVGTNDGYEFQWYRKMGIEYFLGFEPLPLAIEAFQQKYPTLSTGKEWFFPIALGDKPDTLLINQTTGDGQGSSFLDPTDEYQSQHPEYQFIDRKIAMIKRFDQFMEDLGPTIPIEKFDCLVLDVQGYELKVLEGMGLYLQNFTYLNIECSEKSVYQNSADGQQIVDFLSARGFVQDSPMEEHNDVFFIREGA